MIELYNKNMGGVDLFDQLRTSYPIQKATRKWWKVLFAFMLDESFDKFIYFIQVENGESKY